MGSMFSHEAESRNRPASGPPPPVVLPFGNDRRPSIAELVRGCTIPSDVSTQEMQDFLSGISPQAHNRGCAVWAGSMEGSPVEFLWYVLYGPVQDGCSVIRTCSTVNCVLPAHLTLRKHSHYGQAQKARQSQ